MGGSGGQGDWTRRKGGEKDVQSKGLHMNMVELPFNILQRFFSPADNLLTLSYATSDCNYFGLLG